MKKLTVFTPTFNRADKLNNLYASLKGQTCGDFLWLIIDDGSTDNTKELVSSFVAENQLEIVYKYRENHGKYVCHNDAVKLCDTELFVCVDSDDTLRPDAVKKTLDFWEKSEKDGTVCGIISPKFMGKDTLMVSPPEKSTLFSLYKKKILKGETMLVFKSLLLKDFLFPEIEGENFMSESVIYDKIDRKYRYLVQNEYLYDAEYYNDGLTSNSDIIKYKNPKSTLYTFNHLSIYRGFTLEAVKSRAAFTAWKKVFGLSFDGKTANIIIKFAALPLVSHYKKLFTLKRANYNL